MVSPGGDYEIVNKTLKVIPSGHDCVTVIIKDDNEQEHNELFKVSFSELNPELAPGQCMVGGSSDSGMMTTDVLTPMVSNDAVTITIIDNDGMGELAYVFAVILFKRVNNSRIPLLLFPWYCIELAITMDDNHWHYVGIVRF